MTFEIGQRVTWLRTQEGGYRFVEPIAAIVVGVTDKRVKIEVEQRSSVTREWIKVTRLVRPDKLRPSTGGAKSVQLR